MLRLNNAGGSAADAVLRGLGLEFVAAAETMDVATVQAAGIDQGAGFPPTNSVLGSLSPAASVTTRGAAAAYADSTKRVTLASTAGLTAGDYIYFSHASITNGVYQIAAIHAGDQVTLIDNPFDGANRSNIAYQVAWRLTVEAGTSPTAASGAGQANHWKFQAANDLDVSTQQSDLVYIREAPAGAAFIQIDGKEFTGQATSDPSPTIDILPDWPNRGGVSHAALAEHSTEGRNDFRWWDGTTGEKPIADVISQGITFAPGDGQKFGRILLRGRPGATIQRAVDLSMTLDTTGPVISLHLFGA